MTAWGSEIAACKHGDIDFSSGWDGYLTLKSRIKRRRADVDMVDECNVS